MAGCELAEGDVEKIYAYTEGWPSMVYVLFKGIQRGLPVGKSDTINDIIEQNLYNTLSEKAARILCELSFLETFTISMALYVLDDPEASCILQTLIKKNTFVVYNEFDKSYRIRNLLLEFFAERAKFLNIDFRRLYRRAGEWYLRERQYASAFEHLYKAGEVEMILAEFNRENTPDIQFTQFPQIYRIFDGLTQEQCLKYPLAYLQYLRIRAMGQEPGAPGRCQEGLERMEQYVQASGLNEGYKNFLLGEINVVRTFAVFNDLEAMVRCNERALEYFSGGCSCIVTRRKEFTFGSPHLLYSYYREKGALRRTAEYLAGHSECLTASIDGCGTGCDSVALAEYALETGDFDNVELYAYKALYKAKAARQTCLTICAKFALARLEILRRPAADHGPQMMESLREEVLRENNPVLTSTFALCDGYLNACLGRYTEIAEWIRTGDLSAASFLRQGKPFYHTVHAQAVLLSGDYIRLEAVCEMAVRAFAPYRNQLGLLHNAIYMAAAQKALKGMEAGCEALEKALEIGRADGIVLPFAENAAHILDMLEELERRSPGDGYLSRLVGLARAYQKQVEGARFDQVMLTAREKEILQLLERGYKHEQIGGLLFISVTTVRYHIKNIYQKLEVNNKVLAIKKAQELNLL